VQAEGARVAGCRSQTETMSGATFEEPQSRSFVMAIRFLLLQNRAGKTRLAKYYQPVAEGEKAKLEYEVHRAIVNRDPKHTNFAEVGSTLKRSFGSKQHSYHAMQFRTYKIVYRRYAGLFFTLCVDVSDNELLYLEAIHLFVEILDHYFQNVCELDLVFNFHKARQSASQHACAMRGYWSAASLHANTISPP